MNARGDDFLQLVDDYLEGELAPDRLVELEETLRSSEDARRLFWQRAHLQNALVTLSAEDRGSELATTTDIANHRPPARRTIARWGAVAAAAVAILLVATALWPTSNPPTISASGNSNERDRSASAVLGRSADLRWLSGTALAEGDPLPVDRQFELEDGLVECYFASGAMAVVQGPAKFRVRSAMELELLTGTAELNVPPSAHGFEVTTRVGTMRDLGTRFTVRADDDGAAQLHVAEGKVELTDGGCQVIEVYEKKKKRRGPKQK